jgi:hypothetical protein
VKHGKDAHEDADAQEAAQKGQERLLMFSQDKADAICAALSSGDSLRTAAAEQGIKHPTFLLWCNDRPDLADQYARAMRVRADLKFEDLDEVSNEAVAADTAIKVAGLRLKADNIKWQLGKMNPKKYGDKIENTLQVGDSIRAVVREIVKPGA